MVKTKAGALRFIKAKNFDGVAVHLLFNMAWFTLDSWGLAIEIAALFCNSPL